MTRNNEHAHNPDIQTEKVAQSETFVKGAKRQRLPFIIKWTCPMCGERKRPDRPLPILP